MSFTSYQYNRDNIFGYGPPTKSGKIPFTPQGSSKTYETAYWLWGDLPSKVPPLIILHGGPAAPGRDWQTMALLNDKHNIPVLIYDQLGCGESTRLPETKGDTSFWTTELFTSELQNIITHFKIEKYNLLGHSCGCMIAIPFALTQPKGLHKLIIASTSPSEPLRALGFRRRRGELPPDVAEAVRKGDEEGQINTPEYEKASMEFARHAFCRTDPWPKELNEVMEAMSGDDTVQSTLYGGKPLEPTGPWGKYDVVDRLKEITETTVPGGVLMTNGYYDVSVDESMMHIFMNLRAKVKWVRFGQSAHFPHVEEHEAYLTALGDFLTM